VESCHEFASRSVTRFVVRTGKPCSRETSGRDLGRVRGFRIPARFKVLPESNNGSNKNGKTFAIIAGGHSVRPFALTSAAPKLVIRYFLHGE
jgi:hypothetical protein